MVELITEELKNQAKSAATVTGSWTDMFASMDKFMFGLSSAWQGQGVAKGVSLGIQSELTKSEELVKKYEDMLSQPTKHDPNLTYLELIYGKEGKPRGVAEIKSPKFKTKDELDLIVKNQEQASLNLNKKLEQQNIKNKEKEELLDAKTEQEKAKIKRKYAEQQLESTISYEKKRLILAMSTERQVAQAKHDEHVKTLERTLTEYKQKVNLNDKLSPKQKTDLIGSAKGETDKLIAQAGQELITTKEGIDEAYKPVFALFEKLAKARRDALGIFDDGGEGSKEFDKLSHYLKVYKVLMSGITDFVNGEFERQLTIEENHTNKLNEELNNRLLNEKLSASERKNIQNEIAQNDEALRKKQNEIKKKQFNTQKAFNITMAVVDTYAGATKALNDPTIPSAIARMALASATVVSGLAQVAMIARQKFQPDAASTPIRTSGGGGSGGGASRTFDFNLVGSSENNQIADAIGSQFNKPLKAYVVSKDITNQQQLDANTKSAARFGG